MAQKKFNFRKHVHKLTKGFVGREWLVNQIDTFIEGPGDRYLVIVGEAGIGKSALSAQLVKLGKVQAYHFCINQEHGTLDPIDFARSLSEQLTHNLPNFGKHLIKQAAMKKIDVTQEIKELKGGTVYGVYIKKFIIQARSADEAFQVLIREPLRNWGKTQPSSKRVVFLVDALDESARLDRHPNIADLIETSRDLPAQVRWVLTSRPGGPLTELPGCLPMLLDQSEGNLKDVGLYIDSALKKLAIPLHKETFDIAALKTELLTRSQGNFLYLKYVLDGLANDAKAGRPLTPPEQLPLGLDEVYRGYLEIVSLKAKDDWGRIYRPVLGVLAVAQEALKFESLVALSNMSEQNVNDVVNALRQFLDVPTAGKGGYYRIYHTSFADFLTDRSRTETYWIDPKECHSRVADYMQNRFGDSLAIYQAEKSLDLYALRYTATHLALAAKLYKAAEQVDKQHDFTFRLVKLANASDFQEACEEKLGDLPGLVRIVEEAVRRAAEDDYYDVGNKIPAGLLLAVEAALGSVAFRRRHLTPDKIFTHAAAGDVRAAEIYLNLFATEQDWRQAALLHIAWLAADKSHEAARTLHTQVMESPSLAPPVMALGQCIANVLDEQPWPQKSMPQVDDEIIQDLLARLGGKRNSIGQPIEGPWEATEYALEESSYEASIRVTDGDSFNLVAYMANHPNEKHDYVRDELKILASNSYTQYRNRFLWPLLSAVLKNPEPKWVMGMVTEILFAALSTSPLEFTAGLPLTILACRATIDPKARKQLDEVRERIEAEALPLKSEEQGDLWGSYTRHLAALAQGYNLLHREGLSDPEDTGRDLLNLAGQLHFGYAGFQAPASLTLAEAILVCGGFPEEIRKVLNSASDSAHNVVNPTFCARTTARYNALRELWWGSPPKSFDSSGIHAAFLPNDDTFQHQTKPSGFATMPMVDAICRNPNGIPFTALHRVGEAYEGRGGRGKLDPAPDWAKGATTLAQLAQLYGFPVAEFRRLNPKISANTHINVHKVPLIPVPDPEFAPLLAARCAAEILIDSGVPDRTKRVKLIQRLIPIATANPTALDTLLARLLLAAHPLPPHVLDQLEKIIQDTLLKSSKTSGSHMTGAGVEVLDGGVTTIVNTIISETQGGTITGAMIDKF